MSVMNLAAIAMYSATGFACALALRACRTIYRGDAPERVWTAALAMMIALSLARLAGMEDRARDALRVLARGSDHYAERAAMQVPILVIVAALVAVAAFLLWRKWRSFSPGSSRRMAVAAQACLLGFAAIYAVRIVSLHAVDAVLYSGPFRLNYVIEAGLCAVLAASAVMFDRRRKRR